MAAFPNSIALSEFRRSTVEDMIERLIALLDDLDGDCEDEGSQCDDEGADVDDENDIFDEGLADRGYPGPLDASGRDFVTGELACAGEFR